MIWLKCSAIRLARLRDAMKREFLRDPNVLLFERRPDMDDLPGREVAGSR
ncbi:hypothetical protein PX699_14670 [Sphingobium sp. H39-3-25]|nr:hypothetical protein [Sphingobium arseniciresistens]